MAGVTFLAKAGVKAGRRTYIHGGGAKAESAYHKNRILNIWLYPLKKAGKSAENLLPAAGWRLYIKNFYSAVTGHASILKKTSEFLLPFNRPPLYIQNRLICALRALSRKAGRLLHIQKISCQTIGSSQAGQQNAQRPTQQSRTPPPPEAYYQYGWTDEMADEGLPFN